MNRERLPATRKSITHKATIDGEDFYITVGLYEDGRPGEVFVKCGEHQGWCDTVAELTSLLLQAGVPVWVIIKHLAYKRFPPEGLTSNEDIPIAKSFPDYLGRWLDITFRKEKS